MTTPDFRSFHRARLRSRLRARVPRVVISVAVVAAAAWGVASIAPALPPAAVATAEPSSALVGPSPTDVTALAAPAEVQPEAAQPETGQPEPWSAGETTVGQPLPEAAPSSPAVPVPASGYAINVTARGHQAEVDACQWVRMDLGAAAPIVGAHTDCRGGLVLDLRVGDIVTVTGTDLDGEYQVTGSRDAHAGDDAATATEGMTADVIFQTCYYETERGLRLVSAVLVDPALPPVVAE